MEQKSLTIAPARPAVDTAAFTPEQIDLLKRTVCKGASDDELKLFMHVAAKSGLDPFAKQIHALKRKERNAAGEWRDTMSFQTGIDGYRLIAERTGRYEGQTKPEWCTPDQKWVDVWLSEKPPVAARVGVYRTGFREPVYGTALYREFVQTTKDGNPNRMWSTMPANQLAKCAESLALRKAFPQELSGLYTYDEMGQSENEAPPVLAKARDTVPMLTVEPEDESQEPPNTPEDIEQTFPPSDNEKSSKVLAAFKEFGVGKKELEDFLERDYEDWRAEDHDSLRRIYKSMKAEGTPWAKVIEIKAEMTKSHALA